MSNEKLSEYSSICVLVIDDYLKMGDISCGGFSLNNRTLLQQYCDSNNGDVSSGYGFINSHNPSQSDYSSTFKDMYGCVEKVYVSSGYGYINSHTGLQQNGLESLINDNNSNDTDMNDNLQNVDVSSGIGLLNSHTFLQDN